MVVEVSLTSEVSELIQTRNILKKYIPFKVSSGKRGRPSSRGAARDGTRALGRITGNHAPPAPDPSSCSGPGPGIRSFDHEDGLIRVRRYTGAA